MSRHQTALLVIAFAIVTALGGFIGYLTAGSVPSLISGFVFGLLLLACGLAMLKRSVLGYFAACLLTAILLCFFGYKFLNTGKFAPPGIMALASLGVFAILVTTKMKK